VTRLLLVGLLLSLLPAPAAPIPPSEPELRDDGVDTRLSPVPDAFPDTLPDGRTRILSLDLGPPGPTTPGFPRFSARQWQANYAWRHGQVRDREGARNGSPFSGGTTEGDDAILTIGIRFDGSELPCRIQLILGDAEHEGGALDVLVDAPGSDEELVAGNVVARAGTVDLLEFEATPVAGRLSIRLRSRDCRLWAATGLVLHAPRGARIAPLAEFGDRRPPVPPPDDLEPLDREATMELLRTLCEFLLAERLSDGGFSSIGAWYQNAYPIRALLAGGRLLEEPRFTAAALDRLDQFVDRQLADGRWYSTYFGSTACAPVESAADTTSANLADIGTMSLCLALAAPLADSARGARYIEAARRYADRVVLPEQLPDGAFPNRRWMGRDDRHPYSVATATQASSLAALGRLTGEARYLEAAARAGHWLARTVREDGTIAFHAHDRDGARLLRAHDFGDAFYIAEALTWVLASADVQPGGEGEAVATNSREALERHLWGARGLHASADYGYWWKPLSMWTSSKMAAVPYLLARWREDGGTRLDIVDTWIDRAVAWLADPGFCRRIGVLAPHESQTGQYGLVATGFAAIAIAEVLDPGVLLPGPWRGASRVGTTSPSKSSSQGPRPH
jgi:hypothetical protein